MVGIIKRNLFLKTNFTIGLCIWCLLNTLLYVSASPIMQYIPIFFAVWALVILSHEFFVNRETFLKFNGIGYGFLIVVAALLSFVFNRFAFPVKNIYTIVAVAINFMLLYTMPSEPTAQKKILWMAKVITISISIFTLISLILLYFRISIPLGNPADELFIGMDNIHNRYTGIAGNPNGLSRISLSGIISSFILMFFDDLNIKKISYKIYLWCSIIINIISILMTESRGTKLSLYIGIFFTILITTFIYIRKTKLYKPIIVILGISIVTIFMLNSVNKLGILLVRSYPHYQKINSDNGENIEIENTSENENAGIESRYEKEDGLLDQNISNGRLTLIKNGINATIDANLLFGLTYGKANDKIQEYIIEKGIIVPDYLFGISGMMHNTIVQAFVNYGLIGLVFILLFLFYIIKVFLRILCIPNYTKMQVKTIIILSFILFTFSTLNMVEAVFYFDFDNHLLNLILMLSFGFLVYFAENDFGYKVVSDRISEAIQEMLLKLSYIINRR